MYELIISLVALGALVYISLQFSKLFNKLFTDYTKAVEDLTNKLIAKDSFDYQGLKENPSLEELPEEPEGLIPLSDVAPADLPKPGELVTPKSKR